MILDTIENLGKYAPLSPLFNKVVEYLRNTDLQSQQPGRVAIDGNNVFVNYSAGPGKPAEEARMETHNAMIDIQIPISGPEVMGIIPRKQLSEQEYNAEKDITFYPERPEQFITVQQGEFVIFFPQDGHAPGISTASELKKAIFKVKA